MPVYVPLLNIKRMIKWYWSILNNWKFFLLIDHKKVGIHKIYCVKCNKHRKMKNHKISYIFDRKLLLSVISDNCSSKYEKVFKEEEWVTTLKILVLIKNMKE